MNRIIATNNLIGIIILLGVDILLCCEDRG